MLKKLNFNNETIQHLIKDETELVAKTGSWELNLSTKELFWSTGVYRILEIEPNTKNSIAELELEL
jgi:hypothetical protein